MHIDIDNGNLLLGTINATTITGLRYYARPLGNSRAEQERIARKDIAFIFSNKIDQTDCTYTAPPDYNPPFIEATCEIPLAELPAILQRYYSLD